MLGTQLERKVVTSSVREMGEAFNFVEEVEGGELQGARGGSASLVTDDNASIGAVVRGPLLPDSVVDTDFRV